LKDKVLTVLPTDKGNMTVELDTAVCLATTSGTGYQVPETVWVANNPKARGMRSTVSITGVPTYSVTKYLARPLGSHTGHSPHNIENLRDFVCTSGSICTRPQH
jgi:hypothetical protein